MRRAEWWMLLIAAIAAFSLVGCVGSGGSSDPAEDLIETDQEGEDVVTDEGEEDQAEVSEVDGEDQVEVSDVVEDEVPVDLGCQAGQTRCAESGDVESCLNGDWVLSDFCDEGCLDGACILPTDPGTCGAPIALELNQPVQGNTGDGFANSVWSQTCRNQYYGYSPTGPELIYLLDLPNEAMVRFTVTPVDQTYFGLHIRGRCDALEGEYHYYCGGNEAVVEPFVLETYLGPGPHYIIVDDFADEGAGTGAFELLAEPIAHPGCHNKIPTFLDLSSGSITLQGDTEGAGSNTDSHIYHCPGQSKESMGEEVIYAFELQERQTVTAQVTSLEPSDSLMSVYIRDECESNQSGQVACSYSDGSAPAYIQTTLDAGVYYLFVDDFLLSVPDEPQTFLLELSLSD